LTGHELAATAANGFLRNSYLSNRTARKMWFIGFNIAQSEAVQTKPQIPSNSSFYDQTILRSKVLVR